MNILNLQKKKVVFHQTKKKKKMRSYARDLINIADLYNIKLDSDTSKSGKELKILTNKQMLNRLPILLAQIEPGNNSIKLKMKRDKYYTHYTDRKYYLKLCIII